MKPALSTIGQMRLKPDSRALGRGALGDAIDGRSREGKFIRRIEAELLDQLATTSSPVNSGAHAEGHSDAADAEAFSGAIETRRAGLAGKTGKPTRRRPKGVYLGFGDESGLRPARENVIRRTIDDDGKGGGQFRCRR